MSDSVPLTLEDVCIAAIATCAPGAGLAAIAADFDYRLRQPLTFDEISYGLPRLVAAGLVAVERTDQGDVVVLPTARATALYPSGQGAIDAVFAMAETLGVQWRDPLPEDRSLGRLPWLERPAVDDLLRTFGVGPHVGYRAPEREHPE